MHALRCESIPSLKCSRFMNSKELMSCQWLILSTNDRFGAGSGVELLSDQAQMHGFGTVIIDEATQAVEASTLIPMRLGCTRSL